MRQDESNRDTTEQRPIVNTGVEDNVLAENEKSDWRTSLIECIRDLGAPGAGRYTGKCSNTQ
jgi:hypothetical protein